MNQIKVGVIGCGYWGPNLIRNFVDNPNSRVVMVADFKTGTIKPDQKFLPKHCYNSELSRPFQRRLGCSSDCYTATHTLLHC